MSIALLTELAWKSALCSALTLLLLLLVRRRSAGEKAIVALIGILALLLLPVAMAILPALEIAAPQPVADLFAPQAAGPEAASDISAGSAEAPSAASSWAEWFGVTYLMITAAFVAGLLFSIVRLQRLHARSELVRDPAWLQALVAAQDRAGFKHGTALLTSSELSSPVSLGFARPIIIVDQTALAQKDRAEAIVTHELAHVMRMDWLRLIAGRLAVALLWFNPLVWMLVRQSHQLCEEAADDAVLRTRIAGHDYADLLLHAVRHAAGPALLPANGVAPSRSSLSRRIAHVLDDKRPRQPARLAWGAGALVLAGTLNGAVAATVPVLAAAAEPGLSSGAGEQAARELDRIGDPHSRALADAMRTRDWRRRAPGGRTGFRQPAAIAPLRAALRDSDPTVRRIAIYGLSNMRPTPVVETAAAIANLLDDPDPGVRAQAARALGDFEEARYAQPIGALLKDADPSVRWHAAHALGDLQDPATAPLLEAALADPDGRVRGKVAWALDQVREAQSLLRRYGRT